MMYLAFGAVLLFAFIWIGRRSPSSGRGMRWVGAIFGCATALAAVLEAARGAWFAAVCLIVVSCLLSPLTWLAGPTRRAAEMSEAQARSILGVGDDADEREIDAAFRRLMGRVHPDVGGAEGLAVHLNAARERLSAARCAHVRRG